MAANDTITELDSCLACGGGNLEMILDLGDQPLANSYHSGERLPEYPLAVNNCTDCTHSQLTVVVPPDLMFKNYLYVSGTTKTLRDDFERFAEYSTKEFSEKYGRLPRVLDIACNDGSLLERFRERGCDVAGVDPAENLRELTKEKGIYVECDYWRPEVAARMGRFDLIVAMNVVAHVGDPYGFVKTARDSLTAEGKFVQQTSQALWVEKNEFDCVYHEHISYFSKESTAALARRAGLRVERMDIVDIHGGSLRTEMSAPHHALALNAHRTADDLKAAVDDLHARGYSVAGYGAAAKGNTLLNFAKLDLDWIVDDNPLKQGLMTPGRDIPIRPSASVGAEQHPGPLALLLLAWNFEREIRRRVDEQRPGLETVYITPFPAVKISK